MSIRKRPELITLPEAPQMLKISEIPTGMWVMQINLPFTLRHLMQAGVKRAWIVTRTRKSVMTMLGTEAAVLNQMRKKMSDMIMEKYPVLRKHIYIELGCCIGFGTRTNFSLQSNDAQRMQPLPHYVPDVPKLIQALDACGFSDLPLQAFQIQIDKPAGMIITFQRHTMAFQSHGKTSETNSFVASRFGQTKQYNDLNREQLLQLIHQNPCLQNMKAHLCQTSLMTGKILTCLVDPKVK